MKWLFIIFLVVALSFAAQLGIQGPGLWWDEAVYLGLAKGVAQGFYSLDPQEAVESFRPPLFPFLLSPFHDSILAMKVIVFVISILSVLALYKLSLPFGKETALLATLFLSTSFLFVFFSTKLLTEPLFMVFLSLSLLFFQKQNEKNLLFSGLFSGLAFLTRYLGAILFLSLLLTLFVFLFQKKRKKRSLAFFCLPFFLLLAPWLFLSFLSYGSPLEGFLLNFQVYAVSVPQALGQGLLDILSVWSFLAIFLALFFLLYKKQALSPTGFLPFTALFLLTLGFYLAGPHKEARYLLSFLPLFSLLAALGASKAMALSRKGKPLVFSLILLASLGTLALGLQAASEDSQASALVDASLYLKEISSPSDLVLTQSYPFVYALSERRAVPYCPFPQQAFNSCQERILRGDFSEGMIAEILKEHPVTFVLSYKYEPASPAQAREFLEKSFQRVKTFEQWGDPEAVVVYRR